MKREPHTPSLPNICPSSFVYFSLSNFQPAISRLKWTKMHMYQYMNTHIHATRYQDLNRIAVTMIGPSWRENKLVAAKMGRGERESESLEGSSPSTFRLFPFEAEDLHERMERRMQDGPGWVDYWSFFHTSQSRTRMFRSLSRMNSSPPTSNWSLLWWTWRWIE